MMGLSVEVPENGNKSPRNENLSPGAVGRSSLDETEECDLAKLLDKPRALNMEGRQRSLDERSLGDFHMSPRGPSRNADNVSCLTDRLENVFIPSRRSSVNTPRSGFSTPRSLAGIEHHPVVGDAGESLRRSLVYFRGQAVGTIAASDNLEEKLNYDQVFVRDFVPSALAFLMNGEPEIVRNFLLKTLRLQSWEKKVDRFQLGEGVMSASFKVFHDPVRNHETLIADFGESAIGRVAPIDSGFWWIILLLAYTKCTGDSTLAELPECQKGMRLILSLYLSEGFDTFPTVLCADAAAFALNLLCM